MWAGKKGFDQKIQQLKSDQSSTSLTYVDMAVMVAFGHSERPLSSELMQEMQARSLESGKIAGGIARGVPMKDSIEIIELVCNLGDLKLGKGVYIGSTSDYLKSSPFTPPDARMEPDKVFQYFYRIMDSGLLENESSEPCFFPDEDLIIKYIELEEQGDKNPERVFYSDEYGSSIAFKYINSFITRELIFSCEELKSPEIDSRLFFGYNEFNLEKAR